MTTPRLLVLLACLAVALAAPDAQAQYALRANVVGAGATDASGGSVRLRATVGQPAVGRVAGGSAAVGQGFWYPATLSGGGPGPALSVTATPLNPPIVVPAGGGEFRFRITIQNNTAQTQTFQAWINATLPNGSTYHVQGPQTLSLGPNQTFGPVTLQQQIPGWAPAGAYVHNVRVGQYPNSPVATGSFPWTKSGAALGPEGDDVALGTRARPAASLEGTGTARTASAVRVVPATRSAGGGQRGGVAQQEGWLILLDATGEPVGEEEDLVLAMPIDAAAEARVTAEEAAEEEAEADSAMPVPPANVTEVPSVATLMAPSPNPFSRNTTLHFSLSQAGFTTLTVYDVLGREVAVLVDGAREAGWHAVSLDGSRLAAGTYVVRLVARDVAFTRRVTVVR